MANYTVSRGVTASSNERGCIRAQEKPDPGRETRPDRAPKRPMILKRLAARIDFLSRVHSNSPPVASFGSRGTILPKRAGFIQHDPSAGKVRTAFVGANLWTSSIIKAWNQVRLKPWGWNAMALSLNCLSSFETATRHQCVTGTAKKPNISQVAIRQQFRLSEGRAGVNMFNRLLRRVSLAEPKRCLFLNVASEIPPKERSFADDRKSPASTFEVICTTGCS